MSTELPRNGPALTAALDAGVAGTRSWRWRDALGVLVALALGPGPLVDRKGMRRIGVKVCVCMF